MPQQAVESRTAAIRRFNRFYTRRIGVLHEKLADTRFSLTESRLLWELAHRGRTTAAELARDLDLDPGYLSRLLRALKDQKLIASERSASDARHLHLSLSSAGRKAFAPLDRQSEADVAAMLAALPDGEQRRLVEAAATIESILGERPRGASPWLLRAPHPGDVGWVIHPSMSSPSHSSTTVECESRASCGPSGSDGVWTGPADTASLLPQRSSRCSNVG